MIAAPVLGTVEKLLKQPAVVAQVLFRDRPLAAFAGLDVFEFDIPKERRFRLMQELEEAVIDLRTLNNALERRIAVLTVSAEEPRPAELVSEDSTIEAEIPVAEFEED